MGKRARRRLRCRPRWRRRSGCRECCARGPTGRSLARRGRCDSPRQMRERVQLSTRHVPEAVVLRQPLPPVGRLRSCRSTRLGLVAAAEPMPSFLSRYLLSLLTLPAPPSLPCVPFDIRQAKGVEALVQILRAGGTGKAQKEAGAALVALADAQVPVKPTPGSPGWFWSGPKETQEEREFKALEATAREVRALVDILLKYDSQQATGSAAVLLERVRSHAPWSGRPNRHKSLRAIWEQR